MLQVNHSAYLFSLTKLLLLLFLSVTFAFFSGAKNTPEQASEAIPEGMVLVRGTFQKNEHATSGTVSLVQDSAGNRKLVFQNLKTDNGPDLRGMGVTQYRCFVLLGSGYFKSGEWQFFL